MFRIGFKSSSNLHDQIYKIKNYHCLRSYSIVKNGVSIQCLNKNNINNNVNDSKVLFNYSRCKFSTEIPNSEKPKSYKGLLIFGSLTLGTLGILTLAKNNKDIRNILEEWIPGTDKTIKILFQEDHQISDAFEDLKQNILGLFGYEDKKESAKPEPPIRIRQEKASLPKIEPLTSIKEQKTVEPIVQVPQVNKSKKDESKVEVKKPPSIASKKVIEELKPSNLAELEKLCEVAAKKAVNAYQNASLAVQEYNKDVVKVIDNSDTSVSIWKRLKEVTDKKKKTIEKAEEHVIDAIESMKNLSNLLEDPHIEAPSTTKSLTRANIKKLMDTIEDAKKKYEDIEYSANITENYWNKVKEAREKFNEELEILFPNINNDSKQFSINEKAFDLFILHMYNKVNYLQQELDKLETIDNAKLKAALKSTGDFRNEEQLNELLSREINKERRELHKELEIKLLLEKKMFEEELRKQLKLQAQIHSDQLNEILEDKEKETERLVKRTLSEQLEIESNKYKAQLALIVGRLRGLDEALKVRLSEEKGACDAQILWAACQALSRAVKVSSLGTSHNPSQVNSLENEINAVSKVASKDDALVQVTLASFPDEAVKRGVYSEEALRERFFKVEHTAKRLALVPEEGASLPIYLLSYLQNLLLFTTKSYISRKELLDDPIDVSQFDTFDILSRARYWLDRGDFKMTLRYMNLLEGAPKSIAMDWINETRILLETQQAIETLQAYAGSIGLVFLGSGDAKKK